MTTPGFCEIEQPAGMPLVPAVDAATVDAYRQRTYESYESFLRAHLGRLDAARESVWRRDYSSLAAYERSVAPMRARLKRMLGFWVEPVDRAPVRAWDEAVLHDRPEFTARRFRLEVLPGLETYALELVPKAAGPRPGLLAQHGYSGTPELVCGFADSANGPDYSYRSLGVRAALRGYHVLAVHHPSGFGSTNDSESSLPAFAQRGPNYGKNRLHRLAIMGYGTLFGLDMMASSRGLDLLLTRPNVDAARLGMYGLSQGGQSSLFLPAMDERIRVAVCSAYFSWRFINLIGPHRALSFLDSGEEDKFFSEVIPCFSDGDLVSLIAPRAFAVEAGLQDTSVDFEKAAAEFARARAHYERLGLPDRVEFMPHAEGHVSATRRAFEFLAEHLRAQSRVTVAI